MRQTFFICPVTEDHVELTISKEMISFLETRKGRKVLSEPRAGEGYFKHRSMNHDAFHCLNLP